MFEPIPSYRQPRPTLPPAQLIDFDRLSGMFWGTASGDAAGLPVETLNHGQIAEKHGRITGFLEVRGSPYFPAAPAGTTSDDLQLFLVMARCLSSAAGSGVIDMDLVAAEHVRAMRESSAGWGDTTRAAVKRLEQGIHWSVSGLFEEQQAGTGNGVVMKIAPLAAWLLARRESPLERAGDIAALCGMTHRTGMGVSSAMAHVAAVHYCLSTPQEAFSAEEFVARTVEACAMGAGYYPDIAGSGNDDLTARLRRLLHFREIGRARAIEEFKGSSYVYNSLPFSYYFFLRNPRSVESMWDAVNAGGDTDSNAALVGGLIGALNGASVFPPPLKQALRARDEIGAAAEEYWRSLTLPPPH